MKSRTATKDPKKRRCSFQLFAEPSATNAFRAAPWNPNAHAACASNGANVGQVWREASTCRCATTGGWYVASACSAAAGASGSSVSATASAPSWTCFFNARTNFGMRTTSRNDAGISGQGSRSATSLVMVSKSPTLSSRQWPARAFAAASSSHASSPRATAPSAAPEAVAGSGGATPAPGSLRICKRPPSAMTTATSGAVTPAGLANFSTTGRAANAATAASRSSTRSAPIRRVRRSTCFSGTGRSASCCNSALASAKERLAVPA